MKIKSITIQNFKSYGDSPVTFEFSDINLIFGKNSCGKSTAFQALYYFISILDYEKNNISHFNDFINHNSTGNPRIKLEFYPEYDENNCAKYIIDTENKITTNIFKRSPFIEMELGSEDTIFIRKYISGFDGICLFETEYISGFDGICLFETENSLYSYIGSKGSFLRHCETKINYNHPIFNEEALLTKDELKINFAKQDSYNFKNHIDIYEERLNKCYYILNNDNKYLEILSNSIPYILKWENDIGLGLDLLSGRDDDINNDLWSSYWNEIEEKIEIVDRLPDIDVFQMGAGKHCIPLIDDFKDIKSHDSMDINSKEYTKVKTINELVFNPIRYLLELYPRIGKFLKKQSIHLGPLRKQMYYVNNFTDEKYQWYDGSSAYFNLVNNDTDIIQKVNDKLSLVSEHNAYKLKSENFKHETNKFNNFKLLSLNSDKASIFDFSNVGTGVSQALPIIVALECDDSLIIIEQPELHLHPAAVLHMTDFIVDSIKNNNQIFIETHSEHIILRILRHVRESKQLSEGKTLKPSNISVIYIDFENGFPKSVHLPIDEDGDFLKQWPNGFFEERLGEVF